MSEKRKQALVAYLAALFGIAFLVVLVSLIMQIKNGNTVSATAADKVLSLQDEVQMLQRENLDMSESVVNLQDTLLEIQEGTEYLEGVAYAATARIGELEQTQQAYICLVQFQNAYYSGNTEKMIQLAQQMEDQAEFLDSESLQIYLLLKKEIEQPATVEE